MEEEKFWIIECGKRRRAIKKICEKCQTIFLTRKGVGKDRFCSPKCSQTFTPNRIKIQCSYCNNEFDRIPSKLQNSKSGLYFCNRECKEEAQKLGGIKEIQPPHYGTGKISYRDFFTDEDYYCRRCKYQEFKCGIDIHHIDENRENNDLENLIPLCSNCHRGLHNECWELKELKAE